MKPALHVEDPIVAIEVLSHPDMSPPDAPPAWSAGSTTDLRRRMARFSHGEAHRNRRVDVVAAIGAIDPSALEEVAFQRASAGLALDPCDERDVYASIGRHVPVASVALSLGVPSADLAAVCADVLSVVSVIGRGGVPDAASDAAADRLLDRFGGGDAAVAAVSMLYQSHDAGTALFASVVVARDLRTPRRTALARTVRVARADVSIGDVAVGAGSMLTVSLDDPDLEFGAGPHRCPGSELAAHVVGGMVRALDEGGDELVIERVTYDGAGRPVSLPMRRRGRRAMRSGLAGVMRRSDRSRRSPWGRFTAPAPH